MLHVHRAERTARLAEGLAAGLATPLADPFAFEVVAVPAKGVERWLAQRLSTVLGAGSAGDGICSGVVFPSAGRLVDEALAAARGTDPRDDPWGPAARPGGEPGVAAAGGGRRAPGGAMVPGARAAPRPRCRRPPPRPPVVRR